MKPKLCLAITLTLCLCLPTMAEDCLVKRMREAAKGLVYISESDSPVYVFSMQARSKRANQFRTRLDRERVTDWALENFDAFSARLSKSEPWHEEDDKARVARFKRLFELMRTNLSDLQVVYFGSEPIYQVYVFGKDACGNIVGIHMREVAS